MRDIVSRVAVRLFGAGAISPLALAAVRLAHAASGSIFECDLDGTIVQYQRDGQIVNTQPYKGSRRIEFTDTGYAFVYEIGHETSISKYIVFTTNLSYVLERFTLPNGMIDAPSSSHIRIDRQTGKFAQTFTFRLATGVTGGGEFTGACRVASVTSKF